MRYLIFITGNFPWGKGEAFIENEYPFLSESFDRICIISNTKTDSFKRPLSDNSRLLFFPYELAFFQKILAIRFLINKEIRKEISILKQRKKSITGKGIIATLLLSYAKGKKLTDFIYKNIIQVENISPDSIWVYSYWLNDMACGLAHLKIKDKRFKVFARAHRWDVYPEQSSIGYLPFRNFITEKLDMVFTISEHARRTLIQYIRPELHKKIKTIYLGTKSVKEILTPYSSATLHIVSCSNLVHRKRVDKTITALSLINDIEIKWTHLGGGFEEESIRRLANNILSEKPNISFTITGLKGNQEILNFYQNNEIHLFINTSEDEGIPVSVMEAMSFGIAVIATDAGGTSEIVEDGFNGYLLAVNAGPDIIAQSISNFSTQNIENKNRLRQNAYNSWNEKFNANKNYIAFVKQIIDL